MASDVDIVNSALTKLGARPILDFADASPEGRLATRTYTDHRDSLLRERAWGFAVKRAVLAELADAPEWGFDHQYPIPSDCLRVLEVEDDERDDAWQIERSPDGVTVIVTDLDSPLNIRYIAQVEDPNSFDPAFREALAARLAMEWAEPLTQSADLAARMAQQYQMKLAKASGPQGHERTPRTMLSTRWLQSRG